MKKRPLSAAGDVHSMKCALGFMDPKTLGEATKNIAWLQYSLEYEQSHQERITVIRMIEGKIRKIKKQFGIT